MLVFEVPNIIKVFYEKENELIIHEWLEYNPEQQDNIILEIMQKLYETFLEYPVEKVLVRANQTKGSFSPEIQKYIKEVQIPRLVADTKMRYVVTVHSEEKMKRLSTELWQMQFSDGDRIILHDVENEKEARAWLEFFD